MEMMEDLLGVGFHLIDAFPMWVSYDSAKGERVFADCFFDPGKPIVVEEYWVGGDGESGH